MMLRIGILERGMERRKERQVEDEFWLSSIRRMFLRWAWSWAFFFLERRSSLGKQLAVPGVCI